MRGQHEPFASDHVDLVGSHFPFVGKREENDVQNVAGDLDLGALILLEDVLNDQRMQAEGFPEPEQKLLVRILQVDPGSTGRVRHMPA